MKNSSWTRPTLLLAHCALFILWSAVAAAHEVVVLPRSSGSYDVEIAGPDHLAADPLDFGEEWVGVPTALTVPVTNVSRRAVDVTLTPPAGVTVVPAQLVLPAGAQSSLQVTYTRPSAGELDAAIELAVTHVGVAGPRREWIPVTGTSVLPPELTLSIPSMGLDAVESVDLGFMSNREVDPSEFASFDVVVTNTGGATATQIKLRFLELGQTGISPWGHCASQGAISLCVDGEGELTPNHLGELAPGESVVTTWTLVPQAAGDYDPVLRFEADGDVSTDFEVIVEVLPFTLPPGFDFVKAGEDTEGHFGASTDPVGEDPLAQLRPKSFDARTVFSVGEIDTVDLRAGNLTVVIPISGTVPARGPLSYALNAVYNSDLWYRKSLDVIEPEPGTPGRALPLSGEWPDPLYNLRGGWAFHLGRLLPPYENQGTDATTLCQLSDPLSWERVVDTGPRFVYLDPMGTRHEFWARLHGEEPVSIEDGWLPAEDLEVAYTRDGSFLRLVKESPTVRWVEEPGGLRRRFQDTGGSAHASMPDRWVLTRIEDRHGNGVDVSYTLRNGALAWVIADDSGFREVVVKFEDWSGRKPNQPMLVDKVELPGFAGSGPRVVDFSYTLLTLNRPARSAFHSVARAHCPALDISLKVPRLDSIDLPDGERWSFVYTTGSSNDDLRLTSIDMPTGGSIDYEYAPLIWDSPTTCTEGPDLAHPGVDRRTVKDVGGGVLEDTRYLRQIRRTDDVPFGYCAVQDAPALQARPWSEQVVGVWRDVRPKETAQITTGSGWTPLPTSTLTLHYFNVWPYSDGCDEGMEGCVFRDGQWRLDSGRTLHERNVMISHANQADGLYLSTETYRCGTGLDYQPGWDALSGETANNPNPYAGDRIQLLADDLDRCQRQEQTWARYEVSLAGFCPDRPSPDCNRDTRWVSRRELFTNDGDRWRQIFRSEFDGLGHFRKEVTTASWLGDGLYTAPERTRFTRYNPGVGTLRLGPDHRVTDNITPPSTWVLETWDRRFVRGQPHIDVNGEQWPTITRGSEACFEPATGHLRATRTWACPSADPYCSAASEDASLVGVRTGRDVVTRRELNASGELLRQRTFGADTFSPTTGDDWCDRAFDWSAGDQDHGVEYAYQHGILAHQQVHGASIHELDRTVDQATGWTASETLSSGETLDYDYDSMGRVQSRTSDRTASHHFAYETLADGRRQLRARTFPSGPPGSGGPVIRTYLARYDGLGRLWQEDLPTAVGASVTRTFTYDYAGRVNAVTSLDAPSLKTVYLYDYKGRSRLERRPDGSNIESLHYGDRKSRTFTCVATDDDSGLDGVGPCRNTTFQGVEAEVLRDHHGQVLRTKETYQNVDGHYTRFLYYPSGERFWARRKDLDTELLQQRDWVFDGLGNLRLESVPERADTAFSDFDTRGNARTVTIGGRTTELAFDVLSRPTSIEVDGLELKSFSYFASGSGNGSLEQATRRHYHDAVHTASGQPGRFDVTSDFGYDAAGRPDYRRTKVEFDEDGAVPPVRMAEFEQSWTYDVLGNATSLGYPTCLTAGACADDALTVTRQFSQGHFLTGVDASGSSTLDATLTYHPSGLVHEVIHQGGGGTDVYGISGGMPRIASMQLAAGTAQELDLGAVGYDGAGNILSIGSETFSYDRHSRLVAADVRGPSGLVARSYDYDGFDNRITPYAADPDTNRLTSGTYDDFGNLKQFGTASVTMDGLDKIVALTFPQGPDPQGDPQPDLHQIALYDHDDLRIVRWNKNEAGDPPPVWTLRDGLRVIREFDGTGPGVATRADFVYGGSRLISSRRYSGSSYPSGVERHYHQDQVGTSRLITGNDGHEVFTEPFGVPVVGITSGERTVGFQGHETDGATTYMRGRQYFPSAGRFVQVDPVRDESAWSLYAFAYNSPVNVIDPTGLVGVELEEVEDQGLVGFGIWVYAGEMSPLAKYEKAVFVGVASLAFLGGALTGDLSLGAVRVGAAPFTDAVEERLGENDSLTPLTDTAVHSIPLIFDIVVGTNFSEDMDANPEASQMAQEAFESLRQIRDAQRGTETRPAHELHDALHSGDSAERRAALEEIAKLKEKEE